MVPPIFQNMVNTYTKLPGPKWGGNWARFANMPNLGARGYKTMWAISATNCPIPMDGDEYRFEDLVYSNACNLKFVDVLPPVPDPFIDYIVVPLTWTNATVEAIKTAIVGYLRNRDIWVSVALRNPANVAEGWVIIAHRATGYRVNGNWRQPTQWPYEYVGPDTPLSGPQVVSGAPRGEAPGLLTAIGLVPFYGETPYPTPDLMRGGLVTMATQFQYRW